MIVGYWMPNPLYKYLFIICDLYTHLVDNILNKSELIFFMHTVKWFHVLLYNCHNLTSVICLHSLLVISLEWVRTSFLYTSNAIVST